MLGFEYRASWLTVTLVFFCLFLNDLSIEKEMNLDIDRVFGLFFSLKYDILYRLGLD